MSRKPDPAAHERAERHGNAPALLAGQDGTEWARYWMDQMLQGAFRQIAWWNNLQRLNQQAMEAWQEAVHTAASEVRQATNAQELSAVPARYGQRLFELALRRTTDLATAAAEVEKHWVEESRSAGLQTAAAWAERVTKG